MHTPARRRSPATNSPGKPRGGPKNCRGCMFSLTDKSRWRYNALLQDSVSGPQSGVDGPAAGGPRERFRRARGRRRRAQGRDGPVGPGSKGPFGGIDRFRGDWPRRGQATRRPKRRREPWLTKQGRVVNWDDISSTPGHRHRDAPFQNRQPIRSSRAPTSRTWKNRATCVMSRRRHGGARRRRLAATKMACDIPSAQL